MHINYQKSLDKLNTAGIEIEKLINTAEKRSFEDKQTFRLLQTLLEEIRSVALNIEYYGRKSVIGTLQELPNGRFHLKGHELTCGSPLEIYSKELGEWILGRVEYHDTYYFYCNDLDHPVLHPGMKARIRL